MSELDEDTKRKINIVIDTQKLDVIRLGIEGANRLLDWRDINQDLVRKCIFALREGIILFGEHGRMYQYFLSPEGSERGIMIIMSYIYKGNKPAEPILTFEFSVTKPITDTISDWAGDQKNANANMGVVVHESWAHDAFFEYAQVHFEQGIQSAITIYFSLMAYMTFYKEVREIVQKESRSFIAKVKKPRHGKANKRVVRAHRIEYNIAFPKEVLEPREFQRHIESWTVRGHQRTYKKTGKTITVKAHIKGKGTISPKTYTL